jgi:hypothetical protein
VRRARGAPAEAIDDVEVHTYRDTPHLAHPGDYLATVTGFLSRAPKRAIEADMALG